MTDAERIERLERAVEELRQELRRELAALRAERAAGAARDAPAGAPRPAPHARHTGTHAAFDALAARIGPVPTDREGIEALVGRYGTVALAALLILMGVGAFLTWAIANVTIGPTTRVVLGAVAAALLAAAGWRLRTRADADGGGSRAFGNVLLALALAVVHVDAWGAGPYLGLVSTAVALAVAAVASAAIAALARRHREQPLFVVGAGGALVAPFVAGAAEGDVLVLATYGWVVLASGMLALPRPDVPRAARPRRWAVAARLLGLGGAAYAAVLVKAVTAAETGTGRGVLATLGAEPLRRVAPALLPLACAAVALAMGYGVRGGAAYGGGLALAFLASTLGALMALALDTGTGAPPLAVGALAATAAVYAALRLLPRADRPGVGVLRSAAVRPPLSAFVLPLGLLAAALVALPDPVSATGAAAAAAWALLAAAAAWDARPAAPPPGGHPLGAAPLGVPPAARGGGALLGAHVAVAGLASALAPVLLIGPRPVARALALAAHAALASLVAARVRERLALLPPLVALVFASVACAALLEGRSHFAYPPFATRESLAAAAVVAAWGVLAWCAWRAGDEDAAGRDAPVTVGERAALVAAAPVAALLWGREELAHAVSPDVATFLLVGYFAAAGIAAISVGRARRVAGARQAGIGLALYAAVKALAQASHLDPVGLRVGSYLVVGGFLLAVGYWYRAAGDRREPERGAGRAVDDVAPTP